MSEKKDGWIDIADLMPRVSVHQIAAYYRFDLGDLFGSSGEQRTRCPVTSCDGHDDFRSVSVNVSDDKGKWKCHRSGYGCGAQGDKLTLIHCLENGSMPNGKLTGRDFKKAAETMQAIGGGEDRPTQPTSKPKRETVSKPKSPTIDDQPNIPLSLSENESIRRLANLDEQFIVDSSQMTPAARRYMQSREWMTPEFLKEARCGYLPSSAKGTLRGMWVFGIMDENGEPLAWVGRDLKFKEKHEEWERKGRQGKEPGKYRFPNKTYFRRKFELYGQHNLNRPEFQEPLQQIGLTITEGFNDVLRLQTLGVPAVGVMSNRATIEQIERIRHVVCDTVADTVNIMLDADAQGDEGAKDMLWKLSEVGMRVRVGWSRQMYACRFSERETESLAPSDVSDLFDCL